MNDEWSKLTKSIRFKGNTRSHLIDWFHNHIIHGGTVGLLRGEYMSLEQIKNKEIKKCKELLKTKIAKTMTRELFENPHTNEGLGEIRSAIQQMWMIEHADKIVYRPTAIIGNKRTDSNYIGIHPGLTRYIARTIAGLDNSILFLDYSFEKINYPDYETITNVKEYLNSFSYTDHIPTNILKFKLIHPAVRRINIDFLKVEQKRHLFEGLEWSADLHNPIDWWEFAQQARIIGKNI